MADIVKKLVSNTGDNIIIPQSSVQNLETTIAGKQNTLTAGTGITIDNNVISATNAGTVTDVKVNNTSVVTSGVANIDLTGKQDTLTAGEGISITNNVISSTSTGDVADVKLDGTSIVDANKVANININADTLVHTSDQSASAAAPGIDADTLDGHDSNYFSVKSESVLSTPQTMSAAAQAQARANLGIIDDVQSITTGVTTLNGAQGNVTVDGANLPVGSGSAATGSIKEALNELSEQKAVQTAVADAWVAEHEYVVGDYVMHSGTLYKCKTANNDATFTSSKWNVVNVTNETNDKIDSLSSALNNGLQNENRYASALVSEDYLSLPSTGWESGKAIDVDGEIIDNSYYFISPQIDITPGRYVLLFANVINSAEFNTRVHGYDANGNWLRQINSVSSHNNTQMIRLHLDVSSDVSFIRISISNRMHIYGMTKEPFLTVSLDEFCGARLFVFDGAKDGYIYDDSGNLVTNYGCHCSFPLSVKPGWTTVLIKEVTSDQVNYNVKVSGFYNNVFVRTLYKQHPSLGDNRLFFEIPDNINKLVVAMRAPTRRQQIVWCLNGKREESGSYTEVNWLEKEAIRLGLHKIPDNIGVLNAIRRARQQTDIKWTPGADIPRGFFETGDTYLTSHGDSYMGTFKAGVEYTGLPYTEEHYVASEYAIDAFVTSTVIPNGVQALESTGASSSHACYYGTVCTALTSYAFNIPTVYSNYWPSVDGIQTVGLLSILDPNSLKLADILQINGHCAIITDIVCNEDGDVTLIEVSEATRQGNIDRGVTDGLYGSLARRIMMTVSEFYSWFDGFSVLRYEYLETIPYHFNPYAPMLDEGKPLAYKNYPCVPYLGNKISVSSSGNRKIKILINSSFYTHMVVKKNGVEWNENGTGTPYSISGLDSIIITCDEEFAIYTANLVSYTNGAISNTTVSCTWAVRPSMSPSVSVLDSVASFTVTLKGTEFTPWYVVFGTSSSDTNSNIRMGKALKVFDKYNVNDNGDGTYTYTFSVAYPNTNPTHVRVGIHSNDFGAANMDVAI